MSKNSTIILFGCISFIILSLPFLFTTIFDLNVLSAQMRLRKTQNIEVIKLWGHRDWMYEEVSARLKVKNKGEIVLYGISDDVFNYPYSVVLYEIDGFSFIKAIKNNNNTITYSSCIKIGKNSYLGKRLGLTFYTIQDVIDHYDSIANFFKTFKRYPEYNYFLEDNQETFLFIFNQKSCDVDNILDLFDTPIYDYLKTLPWQNNSCKP